LQNYRVYAIIVVMESYRGFHRTFLGRIMELQTVTIEDLKARALSILGDRSCYRSARSEIESVMTPSGFITAVDSVSPDLHGIDLTDFQGLKNEAKGMITNPFSL